jgi:dihydroneopterin aldolase
MAGWINIDLKGLRFFGEHGMYAEERKVGNQFEIDLTVSYKAPKQTITSIEETVNYVGIYRIVEEEFSAHKHLLETCAMQICGRLHDQFPEIKKVCISIKKISPPITNFTGSVGVTFSRNFKRNIKEQERT